jgi:hypothetical protein
VLAVPIRFEDGFSFKEQFTVDTPRRYWVAVQYDEVFRSTIEVPTPRDEFTAEVEVTSQNNMITKGSTATYPDRTGSWASGRDDVTRYLGAFDGRPGEVYQLLLRVTGAQPRLVPKKANAIIEVERSFDEFRPLRTFLLVAVGIVIAIAIFFCTWSTFRSWRTSDRWG